MIIPNPMDLKPVADAIEDFKKLCRKMCEADGNDPDALVTAREPEYMAGTLRGYRSIGRDMEQSMKAWRLYEKQALAALEHIKGVKP